MATVNNKGMVRGTVGSVVYRGYGDKTIVQGKPRKFKQTAETIKASTEFGVSSSTAAVIRQAFQPAYIHRDGEAASRSTQMVYRSIRGSSNLSVGQRDLHDADLSYLCGMEFNTSSKISEVLQTNYRVEKDQGGSISVHLGPLNTKTGLHVPSWIRGSASRYQIRFTLIAFNFRQEYYEFLEVKDVDIRAHGSIKEQTLCFERKAEPDHLLILSISLLAYRYTPMEEGYVLLNSKEFSPCAIITAFEAIEPGEHAAAAPDLKFSEEDVLIRGTIYIMAYSGNRVLRDLSARIKSKAKVKTFRQPKEMELPSMKAGYRVSFKKN